MSDGPRYSHYSTLWHPCMQAKDLDAYPPMEVVYAQGDTFTLKSGQQLIDGIASWWCKSLGHNHPRLKAALHRQTQHFEHVINANTTSELLRTLGNKLCSLAPHYKKVLFASDGSCAVEIAAKLAIHGQQLQGHHEKTQFISLENSYHGETVFTLSLSDSTLYNAPYKALLTPVKKLRNIPYVNYKTDHLWHNAETAWKTIEGELEQCKDTLCAIIIEPILQGAGHMKIYSADFLKRLCAWAKYHGIYVIADEILTGFGRTGPHFACEHAAIQADFTCIAKGLTAGYLPMSAVLTTQSVFDLFYDDYNKGKQFLHSHTHSGNALAAAVALETLNIMEEEHIYENIPYLEKKLQTLFKEVAQATGQLDNLRGIGGMVAGELKSHPKHKRTGYVLQQYAIKYGVFLRPLGNTLYWLPPLNITDDSLNQLREGTINAIMELYS
ncbi:MAG: adenosylmethionine--8-amino-7-oxononanoate transaminase [Gammaproteobacteria bacterium]